MAPQYTLFISPYMLVTAAPELGLHGSTKNRRNAVRDYIRQNVPELQVYPFPKRSDALLGFCQRSHLSFQLRKVTKPFERDKIDYVAYFLRHDPLTQMPPGTETVGVRWV